MTIANIQSSNGFAPNLRADHPSLHPTTQNDLVNQKRDMNKIVDLVVAI
jgi:hypothetical protein